MINRIYSLDNEETVQAPRNSLAPEIVPSLLHLNSSDSMWKRTERQEIGAGQPIRGQVHELSTVAVAKSTLCGMLTTTEEEKSRWLPLLEKFIGS